MPIKQKIKVFPLFPIFLWSWIFFSNFLGISFKPDWYPIFVIFESFDVGSLSKTFGSTDQLNFHLFLGTLTQFTHSFLYIILLLSGLLWVRQFMEVVQSYWKKVSVLQNFGQTLSNIKLLLVSISAKSHGFYWVSKVTYRKKWSKSCKIWSKLNQQWIHHLTKNRLFHVKNQSKLLQYNNY